MPISTIAAPMSPPTVFQPEFFRPYAPVSAPRVQAAGDEDRPRISYSAARHGSYAAFCTGPDFAQYRDEMGQNIDFLSQLAQDLDMPDARVVQDRFRTLYDRRFLLAYYDTHAELLDSAGKRSLDNVCAMLRDQDLPAERRRTVISDLSKGITLCPSGAVANLIAADRDLSMSVGGIRSKLWKIKEDVTRSVLQEAVSKQFALDPCYLGNEIHYVSAAWNYIADAVGLDSIPDLMAPRLELRFLNVCRAKVFAAIAPDKIAMIIAEDCLAEFRRRTLIDAEPPATSGVYTPVVAEWFVEVLNDIRRDLGLEESALGMHAFVRLDDDGRHYHLRADPALIALDLLKAMNADRLLADAPVCLAERVDEGGTHVGLYSYGDNLAWRLRQGKDGAPSWTSHQDVDIIWTDELQAWPVGQTPPPAGVIRKVLRSDDGDAIMAVRAEWLGTSASILALLKRFEDDDAIRYLDANMPYLLAGFPASERADLLHDVITLGKPGRALARGWYPDPWSLLGDTPGKYGPLTQLERWIMANKAAAIDVVRGIIGDGWSGNHDPVSLGDAMLKGLGGIDGRSLIWMPVHSRSPDAIDAVHRLIVSLLNEPVFHAALADNLPILFRGPKSHVRALYLLNTGNAATFAALHRMLFDPVILPFIQGDMQNILLGGDPDKEYPMWSALCATDVALLQAYGALLADVASIPGMEKWLARLTMPNRSVSAGLDGECLTDSALLHVSVADAADVIKAYHAILVHPSILPNIPHMLPELLGPTDDHDAVRAGYLTDSLLNKNLGGHGAYREMITDPLILPHVLRNLSPRLFAKLVRAGIAEWPVAPVVHPLPSLPKYLQYPKDAQS